MVSFCCYFVIDIYYGTLQQEIDSLYISSKEGACTRCKKRAFLLVDASRNRCIVNSAYYRLLYMYCREICNFLLGKTETVNYLNEGIDTWIA